MGASDADAVKASGYAQGEAFGVIDEVGTQAVSFVAELSQVNAIHRMPSKGPSGSGRNTATPAWTRRAPAPFRSGDPNYRSVKGILVAGDD